MSYPFPSNHLNYGDRDVSWHMDELRGKKATMIIIHNDLLMDHAMKLQRLQPDNPVSRWHAAGLDFHRLPFVNQKNVRQSKVSQAGGGTGRDIPQCVYTIEQLVPPPFKIKGKVKEWTKDNIPEVVAWKFVFYWDELDTIKHVEEEYDPNADLCIWLQIAYDVTRHLQMLQSGRQSKGPTVSSDTR